MLRFRYLEAFPDGGLFVGKNFVYDERLAVGSSNPTVLGRCVACGAANDDYGPRHRCRACRMLLLLCPGCAAAARPAPTQEALDSGGVPQAGSQQLTFDPLCTLCRSNSDHETAAADSGHVGSSGAGNASISGNGSGAVKQPARRLRLLCLHGFRQTAKQFHGRTHALRKRLKDVAEFVFVDAPHLLQCYYKPKEQRQDAPTAGGSDREVAVAELDSGADPSAADCAAGRRPGVAAAHKRAWLLSLADTMAAASGADSPPADPNWQPAPDGFDPQQLQTQTEGWEASLAALQAFIRIQGPFDGVLGFSQGAAVAAALCALQQLRQGQGGEPVRLVALCWILDAYFAAQKVFNCLLVSHLGQHVSAGPYLCD